MKEMKKIRRTLIGHVISEAMDKTVVVQVERTYVHPLLKKVMKTSKKYKVHDPLEQAHVGDVVKIYEGRPVSKTKYMYLEGILKPAMISQQPEQQ